MPGEIADGNGACWRADVRSKREQVSELLEEIHVPFGLQSRAA
jgi:hypothetical protein